MKRVHNGEIRAMSKRTTRQFVTRAELQRMLRTAGLTVGDSTLRRYQALGLLPPPRRYGRIGRGRGVDWGWPPAQADEIIRRVRLLRRHHSRGRQLVRFVADDPEMSGLLDELLQEARDEAYAEGFEAGQQEGRQELKREGVWEPEMLNHSEER